MKVSSVLLALSLQLGLCSAALHEPAFFIVGGSLARVGQFPYQVVLSVRRSYGDIICGGALISPRHILTAAHCLIGAESVQATAGSVARNFLTGGGVATRTVGPSFIHIHENYDEALIVNDIGLVEVPIPFPINGRIRTVRLPESVDTNYDRQRAFVSGWGRTSDLAWGPSALLKFAAINVSRHADCAGYYLRNAMYKLNDNQICTDYEGAGTCHGDSGGPLVVQEDNYEKTLIGIVSFGTSSCQSGSPSVYTSVAKYLPWIKEMTGLPLSF